jgi:LPXTG-motif cell wall-anchored protein
MKKQSIPVWVGGLTAAAAAFLFWKKKREAYTGFDALEAQLHAPKPPRSTTAARSKAELRKPTPENGHVHDVIATELPRDDSGSNFSVQNDVHQPGATENKA